eukprot:760810-Hanusia_phi.AAC.1
MLERAREEGAREERARLERAREEGAMEERTREERTRLGRTRLGRTRLGRAKEQPVQEERARNKELAGRKQHWRGGTIDGLVSRRRVQGTMSRPGPSALAAMPDGTLRFLLLLLL